MSAQNPAGSSIDLRYISSYSSLLFTCAFSANAGGGGYVAPSMSVFPSSSESSAKESDWSNARNRGKRVPGRRELLLAHLQARFARANAEQCACERIQSWAKHARLGDGRRAVHGSADAPPWTQMHPEAPPSPPEGRLDAHPSDVKTHHGGRVSPSQPRASWRGTNVHGRWKRA
mmetsp:Transcript_4096/g.25791  ORF Transcript_4096/g.25791 Transcript_4096/m.25791 type:complete len:174 (+) Transcript_4096:3156-3677(+)